MSKRTKNASLAKETLQILDQGFYINTHNQQVSITQLQKQAEDGSVHYRPELFEEVFAQRNSISSTSKTPTLFEVVNETTLDTAKQLKDKGFAKVLALNFASAKNPGGGFQSGAQAQEESLARSSGLYPCLVRHWEMYEINRGHGSCLYTDHMIYSPDVPVFRNDDGHLLDAPYTLSFLTAPAVNAGVVMQRTNRAEQQAIPSTMLARTEKVLSLAMIHGYKVLVLGAWGCGVFRNNPVDVAGYFRYHLVENPVFQNVFEKVVFAVWDRSDEQSTFQAFVQAFGLPNHVEA